MRVPSLDDIYRSSKDRRALHFDDIAEKEKLWKGEAAAAVTVPSHAPGSPVYNATRDGKCAEIVMWWVHHLAEGHRAELSSIADFVLPLMPQDVAPKEARSN